MPNYYLQFLYFREDISKKQAKDQIVKVAYKMEKIPQTRNKWVKDQLNWFKANIEDRQSMKERAGSLKGHIIDHRNYICSFPTTTRESQVCEGSLELLVLQGRNEQFKPLETPSRGSCWAISFLMATIGRHNRELVHELRLSALVYLLNNEEHVATITESRGIPFMLDDDILDLTSHTVVRKRKKSKDMTVEEAEGYGSWVALYSLSKIFDVCIHLTYPRVGPSNAYEIMMSGILNGASKRNGKINVSSIVLCL